MENRRNKIYFERENENTLAITSKMCSRQLFQLGALLIHK